jgi:hypothetical protein
LIILTALGLSLGAARFAGAFEPIQAGEARFDFDTVVKEVVVSITVAGCLIALVVAVLVWWTSWDARSAERAALSNSLIIQIVVLVIALSCLVVFEGSLASPVGDAGSLFAIQAIVFLAMLGMRQFGRNNLAHWRHVQGKWERRYDGATPAAEKCRPVANDETRNDGSRFDEFNA